MSRFLFLLFRPPVSVDPASLQFDNRSSISKTTLSQFLDCLSLSFYAGEPSFLEFADPAKIDGS
jgi:hypothetical protein